MLSERAELPLCRQYSYSQVTGGVKTTISMGEIRLYSAFSYNLEYT